MERIIIDMDEVMCDTMGAMFDWYIKTYGDDIVYPDMKGSWLLGIPEKNRSVVRDRLFSQGFFRHLPVMENCIDVVNELNKKYEVFIVSAAMEFPNSLKDKLEWLNEYFPFLSWRQLVLCGDKRMIAGDYMIDDHVRNLVHFKGKPYLYNNILNTEEKGYERVHNWKEIAEKFL
ncbi:MAG: 5'(3')-deoxyribonucleotidase [Agriterribacter sp.]